MTLEHKNFLNKLTTLGRKIISQDMKSATAWDDLYISVSQLEIDCKKYRSAITLKRDKNEKIQD